MELTWNRYDTPWNLRRSVHCAFLRARKFDYEKTRDMIAEALQKFKEVSAALSDSLPNSRLKFRMAILELTSRVYLLLFSRRVVHLSMPI